MIENQKEELTFSQRFNGQPIEKVIQLKSMDIELRNAVWNCLYSYLFKQFQIKYNEYNSKVKDWYEKIWSQIINKPLDEYPNDWQLRDYLKNLVLDGDWCKVYEFVEELYYHQIIFHVKLESYSESEKNFTVNLNIALRKYNSGYTLLNNRFLPVTNEEEIKEMKYLDENLMKYNLDNISKHFKTAIDLLAQRPDIKYSQVIHECISMVEGICLIIEPQAKTLGDALKRLEKSGFDLHPALNQAFQKLYGYACDADGIRHTLKFDEKENLDMEDARYFLVTCSAFTNYLIVKYLKGESIIPLRKNSKTLGNQ
jgi:AbiJ N-terminal domain 4